MASGMNSSGKNVALPARIRCKLGREWKPLEEFSNTQRRAAQYLLSSGKRFDAANSGMTCRQHSAPAAIELRCDVCGISKQQEEFSKSSRRLDDPVCIRCTAWDGIQEHDVVPDPLQTGHISIEERQKDPLSAETKLAKLDLDADFFDDETASSQTTCSNLSAKQSVKQSTKKKSALGSRNTETDSQHNESLLDTKESQSHLEAFPSLSLTQGITDYLPSAPGTHRTESQSGLGQRIGSAESAWSSAAPPHLKKRLGGGKYATLTASRDGSVAPLNVKSPSVDGSEARLNSAAQSSVKSPSVYGSEAPSNSAASLPPHLLRRLAASQQLSAAGSASGRESTDLEADYASVSTATTVREGLGADQEHPRTFNAWDSQGQHHRAVMSSATPSEAGTDSMPSTTTSKTDARKARTKLGRAPRLSAAEMRSKSRDEGFAMPGTPSSVNKSAGSRGIW
ncbi:hypothetical protein CDD81_3195 [Ophiocordyceps australis]|uniref:Stc1 domain-containing protein n=1 Tax=Ophiocordyceps australis TaxID=1399860 RepID=A0A2C5XQ80_9HYPO|nr:hypothetical protein CDD81_3195 [Ophiocordyceps australis]